mmetsp:Transcript_68301/g.189180  ORF Transcript_68301/g.189180 Transcript_68301/m.189180 type:complete len:224 (-) Transcript_68301:247-918(-)
MPSQRSVTRSRRGPVCNNGSSCIPMSAKALSSMATWGAEPPPSPLRPCSCSHKILSPRRALGSRWSMTRFLTTVTPGAMRVSRPSASSLARSSNLGCAPRAQAAQPTVSSRWQTSSSPVSKCRSSPPGPKPKSSASVWGMRRARSNSANVIPRRNLSMSASAMRGGATQRPWRKLRDTVRMRTTLPVASCSSTSAALRSIAARSSSSRSFRRATSSPSPMWAV